MGGLRSNFSSPAPRRRNATALAIAAWLAVASGLGACGADAPEARRTDFDVAADVPAGSDAERHWQQYVTNVRTWSPKFQVQLVPGRVEVAKLGDGRVQVTLARGADVARLVPELEVLAFPLLFATDDEADYVLDRHVLPEVQRRLDAHGLALLAWAEGAPRVAYAAGAPGPSLGGIRTLEAHAADSSPPPGAVLLDTGAEPMLVLASSAWFDALPPRDEDALRMAYPTRDARADSRRAASAMLARLAGEPQRAVRTLAPEERAAARAQLAAERNAALDRLGPAARSLYEIVERGRTEYAAARAANR